MLQSETTQGLLAVDLWHDANFEESIRSENIKTLLHGYGHDELIEPYLKLYFREGLV
jgi:hypothetical protein